MATDSSVSPDTDPVPADSSATDSSATDSSATDSSAGAGLGYQPALDGVRALAVAAVFAYHAGVSQAPGGFIGVDVFFVLSGFLITGLLLAERHRSGRISLRSFWARRARRLLPALLLLLLAVAGYAAWLAPPDTLASLRRSALATLLYVANWGQITGGQGYFAQLAAPDPLLHTWSLAIEEQFYVLWPLAVLALVRLDRGRNRLLLAACGLGAAASALAMAVLYHGGAGINRVYYGTDTRAQDLLVGAALAIVLRSSALPPATRRSSTWMAPLGLGGVLVAVAVGSGSASWLYQGGFLLVSLAAAGLIAGLVLAPGSILARTFALAPVRYLGRVSYGVYLWHWPVIVVLDGTRTGLGGTSLLLVRAAVTLALAVASFHLLETPLRRRPATGHRPRSRRAAAWVLAAGAVTACLVAATLVPAGAQSPALAVGAALGGGANPPAGPHLDQGIQSQLDAVAAGTGGPVRILLVGDSLATTLAIGVGMGSEAYGVRFLNDAVIGCGLVLTGLVTNRGITAPETGGLRDGAQWVRCDTWPQRWAADEARFHPDVTVLLEGAWEVRDREIAGQWVHVGDPNFDAMELSALREAVQVLGSTGSKVVLLTSPYFQQPDQPDGAPQPADQPGRVDRFNQLLAQVASGSPGQVSLLDLSARVSPSGHYARTVDGIDIRAADGLHFTLAGDQWLQPWLLAALRAVGQAARIRAVSPQSRQ